MQKQTMRTRAHTATHTHMADTVAEPHVNVFQFSIDM